MQRCEFAYSLIDKQPIAPSEPDDEGADADDVWHCPHPCLEGSTFCQFHAPVEETDLDSVATAVEELLAGEADAPPELIGARFATLDLSGTVIDHGATPVDLRDIIVEGEVRLEYTDVRSPLRLAEAQIGTDLTLDSATIAGDLELSQSRIDGDFSAEGAEFASVTANRVDLDGDIRLDNIIVDNQFLLRETALSGALRVQNGTFDGLLALTAISFGKAVDFRNTTFGGRVDLQKSEFQAEVVFENVTFDRTLLLDETDFDAPVRFDGATFARAVAIPAARFAAEVSFSGAQFDAGLRLADSQFAAPVRFDGAVFDGAFTADRAAFVDTVQFAGVTFDATATFDETTYLRAKNGADDDGYTTGAAEFFIKEKVYRRRTYLNGTGSPDSWPAAIINYIANIGLAVTTGYGERPFRPVFASLVTVVVYAAVYLLLFNPPLLAEAGVWEHVLFSGQNFVSFIIGPPPEQSGSLLFRLTTALEAFTGAFFVALFVFSLTRSIDR